MGSKRGSGRCFSSAWRRLDTAWPCFTAPPGMTRAPQYGGQARGGLGRWGDGVPGLCGCWMCGVCWKGYGGSLPPLNAGLLCCSGPLRQRRRHRQQELAGPAGGLFNLQPGEVVKVTFLLLLALQLQKLGEKGLNRPKSVVLLCCSMCWRCAPWCTGCPGTLGWWRCTWPSIW